MRLYVLVCAVGLLVGAIYGVLDVKSPVPPVVALIGLLGMLGGEQAGRKWPVGPFSCLRQPKLSPTCNQKQVQNPRT